MLGAVVGPLFAAAMVWFHVPLGTIILWGIVPGLLAASSMYFLAKERVTSDGAGVSDSGTAPTTVPKKFPPLFWPLLFGVLLFGLGDFSRTFLILLAAIALGGGGSQPNLVHLAFLPMLLYAMHNAVSALAAYPAGHLGDRRAKLPVLVAGYGLGVITNLLLAVGSGSIAWLAMVFLLSGTYIAVEETLEKAVVADLLPRELRSLGLGYLACGNAVGDMASSLYVGFLLQAGKPQWAFGIAAALGAIGVGWMLVLMPRFERTVAS
jgi:MFS family permease